MILAFTAGLVIGTVAGMVSWVAAAAYLESQRLNPTMVEATVGSELAVFSIEKSFAFSPDQTAPARQLYHRRKDHVGAITPSDAVNKSRNSSL
jgi:hypothetical protein